MLPQVVSNWEGISENEQQSMSQMYNFFCGMHLVVNMAETVSESLKLFEKAHNEDTQPSDSESGTIRLVRTTCKALILREEEVKNQGIHYSLTLISTSIKLNTIL